jgi:hypothetical protein
MPLFSVEPAKSGILGSGVCNSGDLDPGARGSAALDPGVRDSGARDHEGGEMGVTSLEASGQDGSAVVEFVFLAVLLMVPVVYLIITVGQLQSAAFAVVGAADQAAKVYVAAAEPAAARAAAEEAVMLAMADHGFEAGDVTLAISCSPSDCLSPGSTVSAAVTLRVPLPLVPTIPGVNLDAARVAGQASQLVGRFR